MTEPFVSPVSDVARALQRQRPMENFVGHCRGQRGRCNRLGDWKVTHRKRVGFITHWWCKECLPAKYRKH